MTRVFVLGGGGHARSCLDVLESTGAFEVVGVVDIRNPVETTRLGYTWLGDDDQLPHLVNSIRHGFVGIGQIRSADKRKAAFQMLTELGCNLPTVISPRAYVARHSYIGEGTIVMHDAIVNIGAQIGRNTIINSQSLIEHDVQVGNNCHISTGAKVNGQVRIGNDTFVGSGAIVHEGVSIGSSCVISAGSVIKEDVADNGWYPGRQDT